MNENTEVTLKQILEEMCPEEADEFANIDVPATGFLFVTAGQ